ncbi:MAG: Hpt domain-containing protein [Opitutaceae bacterium]|jgi:HPt (histidine-containing phosphotransfer) domain-containing protein
MPDPNIIDPEAIATLKELNPDDDGAFLKEIVGIYLEDTPKRLQDLKESLASGNVVLFTRTAHTIKGSSANVGAVVLAGVAERLETLSRKEGLGGVAALVAECEQQYGRAAAELRTLLA